jgi:dihydroceramidase
VPYGVPRMEAPVIPPHTSTGVWGPPTSSVDWCETNYEHTRYLAELFNTVSSFAMCAVALMGIFLHRRVLERRFTLAFAVVMVVGLGSAAFHGTLRFQLQMLDELPMLYSALVIVYILLEDRPQRRFGAWFPALLVAHGVLVTALSALTRGRVQFFAFQLSFGSMEFFALYKIWRIYRRSENRDLRRLYRVGMVSYLTALACWITDLRACDFVSRFLPAHGLPNPQLHAWWHVLVSAGMYLLTLVMAHDRLRVLGRRPMLSYAAGLVPCVRDAGPVTVRDLRSSAL